MEDDQAARLGQLQVEVSRSAHHHTHRSLHLPCRLPHTGQFTVYTTHRL